MQIVKAKLTAKELAVIEALANNKALRIQETESHYFFPLSTLTAMKAVRPAVIFHTDTIKGATVFFDVASRNAEVTCFVFDTAFEAGGYHVEFEMSQETLIDICTDLDLFETDGDGKYYTYKEFGENEFGERESARCYQDLDELVNELETYQHADILKAYIQQKGLAHVEQCRAAAIEEDSPKTFKSQLEALFVDMANDFQPVATAA